jgi:hypothetical protein
LNIPITLPEEATHHKITEKVGESRGAREQSKQQLEIAKTEVGRAFSTRGYASETGEAMVAA